MKSYLVAGALFACAVLAADPGGLEERVADAAVAADSLAGAVDIDLEQLFDQTNRNFLAATTEEGGTVRAARNAMRQDVERRVIAMGEVKGQYAEAALLIRELWHTADAEMELVLGDAPIDDDLERLATEHRTRVAQIRSKLQPLLPSEVHLLGPFKRK